MPNDMNELSLDHLFSKLHRLMKNLVTDVDSVIEDNKEMSMESVRELRESINSKLGRKEEIQDNQRLLKLLNLFSEDKAVIEIIREDADEWVKLLESIEGSITEKGGNLTPREKNEVKEINRLTSEIKSLIRKEG